MKELKKYGLESSIGESENLESKKFRRSQNEWGYGHGSLPEIEIRPSGHGSSSDSDSWNSSGINPDTGGNLGGFRAPHAPTLPAVNHETRKRTNHTGG